MVNQESKMKQIEKLKTYPLGIREKHDPDKVWREQDKEIDDPISLYNFHDMC